MVQKIITNSMLYGIMIINVIFGTGDTFLLKLQDETHINNSKFFHPFL